MSKLFSPIPILLLGFFSLSCLLSSAAPLEIGKKIIEVKVSEKKVKTGDIFEYKVTVQGELASSAQLKLPEFKGLNIVSQRQSQNYSTKQGVAKTTLSLTYLLFAPEPGVYTIEPVTLESDDQEYRSSSVTIKATGKPLKEMLKILPYIEKGTNL